MTTKYNYGESAICDKECPYKNCKWNFDFNKDWASYVDEYQYIHFPETEEQIKRCTKYYDI